MRPQKPVKVVTDSELEENGGIYELESHVAIRVRGSSSGGKVIGGARTPVYVVSDADIASGKFKVQGGFEEQVSNEITTRPVSGYVAIPVYAVNGNEWPSSPISWLFRDDFTDTTGSGSIDDSNAVPGPGIRYVKGGFTSTDGSDLVIDGTGVVGDGYAESDGVGGQVGYARDPGLAVMFKVTNRPTPSTMRIGWTNELQTSGAFQRTHPWHGADLQTVPIDITIRNQFAIIDNNFPMPESFSMICILRTSGAQMFANTGAGWFLCGMGEDGNYATAYARMAVFGTTEVDIDFLRIVQTLFLASPLASDGFTNTFGITDGEGHPEGVAGGIGSGGGSKTWTSDVGTWITSSGHAESSSHSGGEAIATLDVSRNVYITLNTVRVSGSVGCVALYSDSNNYLKVSHDGSNLTVDNIVDGSSSNIISGAITYVSGAFVVVRLDGINIRAYYNNSLVGESNSIDVSLPGTRSGIYTSGTVGDNEISNFAIYSTSGYSELDPY